MEAVLTRGAVATIAESKAWHTVPVVLQVVDTVWLPPLALRHGLPNSRLRVYALVLSDGVHTHEMDLITPLRHLVKDGHVCKGSVVRLVWYCIVLGPLIFKLEVLQAEDALIGSPVPYEPACKDEEPDAKCAAGDAAASGGSSGQGTSSSSARRVYGQAGLPCLTLVGSSSVSI